MTKHTKKCSMAGCGGIIVARGWCNKHYKRWRKYGNPEYVSYVVAETLEESFARRTEWQGDCLIWVGWTDKNGNGQVHVNGERQMAHRYAWERVEGPIPDGMLVVRKDHCNEACVNVDHLRLATVSQNTSHKSSLRKSSKSGIRNVLSHGGKWQVVIMKNGKRRSFGVYDDLDEAAEVAQAAREELFGAYAGKG